MPSVEEKLLAIKALEEARKNPVKVEPSVVVAEKKEEFLEGKAFAVELPAKAAEEKKVSKVKKEK